MLYAKRVIKKKGSTILSLQEQRNMEATYGEDIERTEAKLTGKQKVTLILFRLT